MNLMMGPRPKMNIIGNYRSTQKKNLGEIRKGNRVANNLLVGAACLFCVKITLYGNLCGKSKSAV